MLLITRHGQTEWNVEHKVQGKADISLNSKGIEQALETKQKLESQKIDLILCSPLKRVMETAKIINTDRNIPIIYDEKISERDFGEFEGTKQEDFDFKGFWSYTQNMRYERAENIRDFFNRIYSRLDEIKIEYKGKNILLVSHGGVSIPVNCYFNNIPNQDDLLSLVLGNCEIANYSFEKEKEDQER